MINAKDIIKENFALAEPAESYLAAAPFFLMISWRTVRKLPACAAATSLAFFVFMICLTLALYADLLSSLSSSLASLSSLSSSQSLSQSLLQSSSLSSSPRIRRLQPILAVAPVTKVLTHLRGRLCRVPIGAGSFWT